MGIKKVNLHSIVFIFGFILFFQSQLSAEHKAYFKEQESNYEYYLAVCAIFNNEAPWLKEWLEYHKLIGVEHFYLYNNESTDNYLDVLDPYIKNGEVTLINWLNRPNDGGVCAWVDSTQVPAYLDCITATQGVCRWVAFIDIDEFIVPRKHDDLISFLQQYDAKDDLGGITINWSLYGTSGYWDIPPGKLMMECLTRKDDGTHIWATVVKSIVHPEYVVNAGSPHFFQYMKGKYGQNPDGKKFRKHRPRCIDHIKINHYYVRTLNYFYNVKLERKEKMDNKSLSLEELNMYLEIGDQEEDRHKDIFRFIPMLKEKLGADLHVH